MPGIRRPTLAEKQNGPGFRDRLLTHGVQVLRDCRVETCSDPVTVILTLYVDAHPPGLGWYEKLLRTIEIGVDMEVGFCTGHAADVIALDEEWALHPELWEPGRVNPPVMPGPGRAM